MTTDDAQQIGHGQRRRLSPLQVAKLLDERLYDPRLSLDEFVERCRVAADARVAAVVCQPSRVALAAHLLAGQEVAVAASPAIRESLTDAPALGHLLAETEALLEDGATEIGLLAPPGRLGESDRAAVAKALRAVAELCGPRGAKMKVILPTSTMAASDLRDVCTISVDCGAAMVQGGTSGEDRASLRQIAVMRQAMGDQALLKWAAPIGDLDRLLLAHAEGVGRFNADTTAVLMQAAIRHRVCGIRIPEPGRDYARSLIAQ